jgi:hypothetical protein
LKSNNLTLFDKNSQLQQGEPFTLPATSEKKSYLGEGRGSLQWIENPGLWLSVRAGELAIRQRDGHYVDLSRRIKTIMAAAHGFAVPSAAVRYCSAKHIELLISDDAATFVSMFAPTSAANSSRAALKVRERQFKAAFEPTKTTAIARAIVAKKIAHENHPRPVKLDFLTTLRKARTTDDVRHAEAKAAQEFWRQFIGFKMRFAGPAVAAQWLSFPGLGRTRCTIHPTRRGASLPSDPEFCNGNCNRPACPRHTRERS